MNKKNLQGIFLGAFILILLIILVYAAETATLGSPLSNTNYTSAGTLNFSCNNVSMEGVINATLFYNISGGAINVSHNLTFLVNASANQSIFGNVSVNLTGLSDATTYNMTCFLDNDSAKVWSSSANITIDATAPNVSIFSTTVSRGNYSGIIIINTSVTDATIGVGHVYFNITNFSTGVQVNYTKAAATGTNDYNITVDTSKFTDGQYTITVWANDSLLGKSNSSNNFTANMNNSESINVTFDNTAPTATYTCSPSTVSSGDTVTCTCSPSDPTSGINESQTSTTTPTTSNTGLITETCNFVDNAGNSGSQTATYTVEMSGSGTSSSSGSSGSTTATATVSKTHSWSEITTDTVSKMENFKSDVGIKQIEIEVNNKAQNVKVVVTKYDSKPAKVTKEKTGDVYKYLQIATTNLNDKLSKATVTIQVEKTWASGKGLNKEDVSMFKFDETSEEWNELTTTYVSEDDTNYVYDVELTSFSYFTIAGKEKAEPVVEEEKSVAEKVKETGEQVAEKLKGKNLFKNVWFWVIVVIVLVLIGYGIKKNQ
ncbi:hypothetical protein CMI39_02770 [Candidatus Pacearchaeota archaeon]|jgi:PGF-pre-PGF domain-containing protein|nr:hypothetical protein [Candidatus Pacearchaeota archaeon]|tara:strand:- start:7457 stop:9088 length:1632 start_codon:yes stop_codon:yes gene_type:complete